VVEWLDSSRLRGRKFNSQLVLCQVTTLGKLSAPMCLCSPSSIIWYWLKGSDALPAWKVTVGHRLWSIHLWAQQRQLGDALPMGHSQL